MVEENTSAWQMGNRTLERINLILVQCELARTGGHYNVWFDKLLSLYLEVLPFMNSDKSGLKDGIVDNIEQVRKKLPFNALTNATDLKKVLFEIEAALRGSLLKYNLLIPKSDDPRAAVFKT